MKLMPLDQVSRWEAEAMLVESLSGVVGFQFGWAEGLDVGVVRRVQPGRSPAGIGCLGGPVPYLVDRV